jgi:molybdopterin/thiamine biosynthesis adenylyltransferase
MELQNQISWGVGVGGNCQKQGCTNPGCQVALETKFCTVTPNIFRVFTMELPSSHRSGAYRFEMASRFCKLRASLLKIHNRKHCSVCHKSWCSLVFT